MNARRFIQSPRQRERPRGRAAKERDEVATSHVPFAAYSHCFTEPVGRGGLRLRLTRPTALRRILLLHVAPHGHFGGPASIDVARVVHADAFRRAGLDRRLRNEGGDLAVLDAADADALLEARIVARGRLRIGDVKHVVLVDGNVARPPELLPFGNELAVRLENLFFVTELFLWWGPHAGTTSEDQRNCRSDGWQYSLVL